MAAHRRAIALMVALVAALVLLLLDRSSVELSFARVADARTRREPGSDHTAATRKVAPASADRTTPVDRGMSEQDNVALDGVLGLTASADGMSVYAVAPGTPGGMSGESVMASVIGWRRNGTGLCCREVITDTEHLLGARDVVVSSDGKSVYVASDFADCITQFDRDVQTGALSNQVNHVDRTNLNGAYGVAVSNDGANVYAVAHLSDTVVTWDRNTNTGVLSNMRVYTDPVGLDGACSIKLPADGASVFVSAMNANAIVVFDRSLPTGDLSDPVAHVDSVQLVDVRNIALSRDGASVYATAFGSESVMQWQRDPISKVLSNHTVFRDPVALSLALDAEVAPIDGLSLYATSFGGNAVVSFDRDPATGRVSNQVLQADTEWPSSPRTIAIDAAGSSVYVVADGPNTIVGFERGLLVPAEDTLDNESTTAFPFPDVEIPDPTLPAMLGVFFTTKEATANDVEIGDGHERLSSADAGTSSHGEDHDGAALGWIVFAIAMALLLIGAVVSASFMMLSRRGAQSNTPSKKGTGDVDGGLESRHQQRNHDGPLRRATQSPPLSRLPSSPVLLQNLSVPLTIPTSPQRVIDVASLGPTKQPNSIVRDLTVSNPHRRSSLINGPSVSRISERSTEGYELGDDTEI